MTLIVSCGSMQMVHRSDGFPAYPNCRWLKLCELSPIGAGVRVRVRMPAKLAMGGPNEWSGCIE